VRLNARISPIAPVLIWWFQFTPHNLLVTEPVALPLSILAHQIRAHTLQMVERWLNLFKANFVRAQVQLIAAPTHARGIYFD
jgi:hypothetical protein